MSFAVGNQIPPPGFIKGMGPKATDPVTILQNIQADLDQLNAKLNPVPLMQQIPLNGMSTNTPVQVIGPYNSILASLIAGTINFYFGSGNNPGAVPDLQFGPTITPAQLFFPVRADSQILLALALGSGNATGCLYLINY